MEAVKGDGFQHVFSLSGEAVDSVELWFLTKSHHSLGLVVKASVIDFDVVNGNGKGRLNVPFDSSNTYAIVANYFSKVVQEKKVLIGEKWECEWDESEWLVFRMKNPKPLFILDRNNGNKFFAGIASRPRKPRPSGPSRDVL